jgi:uncharacterized protein (DUF2235 family)
MKRMVLCCDGTWNRADQTTEQGDPCPTNVVRFAYLTAKRDGDTPQILFYDQGVGTGNRVDRLTGGAFGQGLEDNIHDAYRFLIANWEPGDEIFLLGFSRGAFTARSIAGMVRKCGILKRQSVRLYRQALAHYRQRGEEDHPDDPVYRDFRAAHSLAGEGPIPIRFVGVWDTVGSLGIPLRGLRSLTRRKYRFHDTDLSASVEHAYHALAIDERRAPFEPTQWTSEPKGGQKIEQVWFAGVHSDIGGGYGERKISDLSLGWMLDKARGAGLALDQDVSSAIALDPDPLAPLHDSKKGLYKATRGIDRPIGLKPRAGGEDGPPVADRTQSLHPSVLARWDADASYRPTNLADYFRRTGDPRAGG